MIHDSELRMTALQIKSDSDKSYLELFSFNSGNESRVLFIKHRHAYLFLMTVKLTLPRE